MDRSGIYSQLQTAVEFQSPIEVASSSHGVNFPTDIRLLYFLLYLPRVRHSYLMVLRDGQSRALK